MSDLVPKFERRLDDRPIGPKELPTAGAIRVKNERGEYVTKKVKVQRHVAGQAPKFGSEDESDEEDFTKQSGSRRADESRRERREDERDRRHSRRDDDRRDRRDFDRRDRHRAEDSRRRIEEPEIVRKAKREPSPAGGSSDSDREDDRERRRERALRKQREREREEEAPLEHEDPEMENDEEEIQKRRDLIKMQRRHRDIEQDVQSRRREELKQRRQEEELLKREKEEESDAEDEEESEESEEESESSEEEAAPLLKPVFVQKRDRVTLIEAEEEEKRMEALAIEEEKRKEERKQESVRIMEETLKREEEMKKQKKADETELASVNTDDENEEVAYELWKIREMKRLKRNRDEREALAREQAEVEKIHRMTEEERQEYAPPEPEDRHEQGPSFHLIRAEKGKMKLLQKYFHRGAFFLDQEDEILKRDFTAATGDDEFDKSILPKVMQVKNFGKASRSKWTHLTAEDTTDHQGVWATETPISSKFVTKQAAGMKNVFERPAAKKRKMN
ncbi:MFAP1 domain-containing protein [Aphelenchoides fujianensis]|nr:MFAP1 domain-containing protein [Aphelenchoides fujianensis]